MAAAKAYTLNELKLLLLCCRTTKDGKIILHGKNHVVAIDPEKVRKENVIVYFFGIECHITDVYKEDGYKWINLLSADGTIEIIHLRWDKRENKKIPKDAKYRKIEKVPATQVKTTIKHQLCLPAPKDELDLLITELEQYKDVLEWVGLFKDFIFNEAINELNYKCGYILEAIDALPRNIQKRYYRRCIFFLHPDKNSNPDALHEYQQFIKFLKIC